MIYVTGDTHGRQIMWDTCIHPFLKEGDTIVVTGDFGVGFFDGRYWPEEMFYDELEKQKYTVLFLDGNHEDFNKLKNYPIEQWHGGRVQFLRKNVIHLMRGELYEFGGKKVFCFGGGYSLDKEYRVEGKTWWPEEMPSEEEYQRATHNLEAAGYEVNYILTHTAPDSTVEYLTRMNLGIKKRAFEELPLNSYLQWVVENVKYEKWYFGHFHIDRELWRNQYVLLDNIRAIDTGRVMGRRGMSSI